MTFQPGLSGNPAGRPAGARNKRTIIREALDVVYEDGEQGFWLDVAQRAHDGDSTAAAMLAKRLVPALKPQSPPMDIELAADPHTAARQIVNLAAGGELTAEGAQALLTGLSAALKVKEMTELEERVRALEAGRNG